MKHLWIRVAAPVVVMLSIVAASAPSASAYVVHRPNGRFLGVMPRQGISLASIKESVAASHAQSLASAGGALSYHGGPVLHSTVPYLIFWLPTGESLPAGAESLMARYFADVAAEDGGATNVFGVDRQYYDQSGIANYAQTFSAAQVLIETTPYPTRDVANCRDVDSTYYPKCITDAQLQTELAQVIAANRLPTGANAPTPIYFMVTPSDVNICYDASDCADTTFCAYHSSFADDGSNVLYATIPFFLSADPSDTNQHAKTCQNDGETAIQEPNGSLADVAISYMSHEDNETITDPLGTGWWDSATGNEEADNCASISQNPQAFEPTLGGSAAAGTLYDQLINGNPYYTQAEWSNGDAGCEMRPTPGAINPSFSAPNAGFTPVGDTQWFDPSATTSISSATWSFGDGTQSMFQYDFTALSAVEHVYAAAGRYPVTLSLVDGSGNVATTTEMITIGSLPISAFVFSPSQALIGKPISFDAAGSFDGDAGVTISSYTWNFGDGSMGGGLASSHIYKRAGTYTVSLLVTSSLGLTQTTSHQLTIVTGRITKLTVRKFRKSAAILVTVTGPGALSVERKAATFTAAGTKRILVRLSNAQLRTLAQRDRLVIRVPVRFVPLGGSASKRTVTIRFRRQ